MSAVEKQAKDRSALAEVLPPVPSTIDASSIVDLPKLFEESPKSPTGAPLRKAMGLVTVAWVFGSVWTVAISGTPLTLFARTLGASPFQFGLLAAIPFAAS